MPDSYGIKELYDVSLRTNKPIVLGKRKFDINEAILRFKQVELAQMNEQKKIVSATGGFGNANLIDWETDKSINFGITNGVLSPISWSLLSNSELNEGGEKSVQYYEELKTVETDEYSYCVLKYFPNSCGCKMGAQPNPDLEPLPMGRREELLLKPLPPSLKKWIFVYDKDTQKKVDFKICGNKLILPEGVRSVLVDYTFDYQDIMAEIEVGNRLQNGFFRLDGKMSAKDDKTGRVTTVLIEMPKIQLSSNLSVRLGRECEYSVVSDFFFTAFPPEDQPRQKRPVANITFLNTELSGEYI